MREYKIPNNRMINDFDIIGHYAHMPRIRTESIESLFKVRGYDYSPNLTKLAYLTQEKIIFHPLKAGNKQDEKGGSVGLYQVKTPIMIWYYLELKKRMLKNSEIKIHMYNYFAKHILPPKPVKNTPLAERIIYAYRINELLPYSLFDILDFNLYLSHDNFEKDIVSVIPCKKLVFYRLPEPNIPVSVTLIPTRNLSQSEFEDLQKIKTKKSFLINEGINIFETLPIVRTGKFENIAKLRIFDKYPLEGAEDNIDYKLLLNPKAKYEDMGHIDI